jgi:hypothetical protein
VASVLEYQGRSVEQGHDDRGTSALQLPSGEAVRRVAYDRFGSSKCRNCRRVLVLL